MKPGLKIAALAVAAVAVSAILVIYFQRMAILQYTAETVIRNVLPEYIKVRSIVFDVRNSKVSLKGFSISNPPGFSSDRLIEIEEVSCRYGLRGKSILDGMEILDPEFKRPVLHLERRSDGRLNVNDMSAVISKGQGGGHAASKPATLKAAREEAKEKGAAAGRAAGAAAMVGKKKVSDIIKLPQDYAIRNGKMIFTDMAVSRGPHVTVFDGINGRVTLKLNDAYTQVLRVASAGEGFLNGRRNETVGWIVDLNPAVPRLTMSNRFEVAGVEIKAFEPYYDRYSPVVFQSGSFSGTLVFDFDNGNIGSTNEIRLSGISFYVKPGAENAQFWGSTVPDIVKYFRSASGDIIFDFKIKGDMANPTFHLGPISKRAVMSMAIDKISAALADASSAQSDQPPRTKEEAQVRAISDAVKLLMKKAK